MSRSLKIAVQMDPLESIDINGDSTFALMIEAQRRGYPLFVYSAHDLQLRSGSTSANFSAPAVVVKARSVRLQREVGNHVHFGDYVLLDLSSTDVILMRQDPPFDMGYLTATYMLGLVRANGGKKTLVVNDPRSVRDFPEKLMIMRFPSIIPPTIVTAEREAIYSFRKEWRDIIVKLLYGNAGAGIFRIKPEDENFSSLLDMFFTVSSLPLMFQRYEPAVKKGDKRVILADGEPVGVINRVPPKGDVRANMHVGGRAEKAVLTERDIEICRVIAPTLKEMGLVFVGIDIIGHWMTEINVTSPTGLQEIDRFDGINSASVIWAAIEARIDSE